MGAKDCRLFLSVLRPLAACVIFLLAACIGPNSTTSLAPFATQRPPTAGSPLLPPTAPAAFDGDRALDLVRAQLDFGPRTPGSPGHAALQKWAEMELAAVGWQVEFQVGEQDGQTFRNIVARRGGLSPQKPWVILGAHYDTRFEADQDPVPERRIQPVPGANDGASGVAVLLELARSLPTTLEQDVWIVLFDLEDNGGFDGWDWILGSRGFAEGLPRLVGDRRPEAVVVIDMVGDADLNIHLERNSDPVLSAQIWETAGSLGFGQQFISQPKYAMTDDHQPFLRAGIPAVLLIDFDYPYWHTTADTLDKISADSLDAVGETLLAWLLSGRQQPVYP